MKLTYVLCLVSPPQQHPAFRRDDGRKQQVHGLPPPTQTRYLATRQNEVRNEERGSPLRRLGADNILPPGRAMAGASGRGPATHASSDNTTPRSIAKAMYDVKTESQCRLCGNTYGTRGAGQHLQSCLKKLPCVPGSGEPPLLVSVHGDHPQANGAYVLFAIFPHDATLEQLDVYLRYHWLECCGHLSRFESAGREYLGHEWPDPEPLSGEVPRSMRHPIADAITPGSPALYEYDMGDTTSLTVRVQTAPPAAAAWQEEQGTAVAGATVMRNLMPERCRDCGGEAAFADGEGYVCAVGKRWGHERPLFNSPRDGADCFDEAAGPDLEALRMVLEVRREATT